VQHSTLINYQEIASLTNCLEEHKFHFVTYALTREARLWWHHQRDLLTKKLGSEEAIIWA
jgi:hypothetical protein